LQLLSGETAEQLTRRASITAIAGFSPIFSGAVQMLTHA
jgi:hypothetical protein